MPRCNGSPAIIAESFSKIGTPRNGPSTAPPAHSARASSNRRWITAFSEASSSSTYAIPASTNSSGLTSPAATSSAWPTASRSTNPPTTPNLRHTRHDARTASGHRRPEVSGDRGRGWPRYDPSLPSPTPANVRCRRTVFVPSGSKTRPRLELSPGAVGDLRPTRLFGAMRRSGTSTECSRSRAGSATHRPRRDRRVRPARTLNRAARRC
jgi:hypothetical protein